MKFTNAIQVEEFKKLVDSLPGEVWLESPYGDRYNLKSALSQFVALGELVGKHGDELELFANDRYAENQLMEFLNKHPEILAKN